MCGVTLAFTAIVLLFVCVCLAPAVTLSRSLSVVTPTALVVLLALLPIAIYGAAAGPVKEGLRQRLPHGREKRLRGRETRALTLAGFSLASLSVLLRSYGEQVGQHEESVVGLAIALGFFVGTYLLLRYREKWYTDYFSDALLDSGLWCVFISLAFLFWGVLGSAWALSVAVILMIGFVVSMFMNIRLHRDFLKALQSSDHSEEMSLCPYCAFLEAVESGSCNEEVQAE